MTALLRRFAQALIAKIRRFAREYTLVRRTEVAGETMAQELARRVLVWSVERIARSINRFPMLHPDVAARARTDFDWLARDLFATHPHPNGSAA